MLPYWHNLTSLEYLSLVDQTVYFLQSHYLGPKLQIYVYISWKLIAILQQTCVHFEKCISDFRTNSVHLVMCSGILLINVFCCKSDDCFLLDVHNHRSCKAFHSLWSNKSYLTMKACCSCHRDVEMQRNLPNKRKYKLINWIKLQIVPSNSSLCR